MIRFDHDPVQPLISCEFLNDGVGAFNMVSQIGGRMVELARYSKRAQSLDCMNANMIALGKTVD